MDGNNRVEDAVVYVSRLMGQPVGADEKVTLRSVHRAALSAWARKENVALQGQLISSGAPFSMRELLMFEGDVPVSAPPKRASASVAPSVRGIGIDIEDVSALPVVDDFRSEPFYQNNFTPSEIAYCIRRPDSIASFCGLWAAKEAILKSGMMDMSEGGLNIIEITWDAQGRPMFPGCQLSISHTPHTAVAVCMAIAPAVATVPAAPSRMRAPAEQAPQAALHKRNGKKRALAFAVVVLAICILAYLGIALARH